MSKIDKDALVAELKEQIEARKFDGHPVSTRSAKKIEIYEQILDIINSLPDEPASEDERVRKALIEFLRESYSRGNAPEECAKWLVWLEQQKEQKPVEWSEEDVRHLYNIIFAVKNTYNNNKDYKVKLISWLKSLRPSWKPSEEQMVALDEYIYAKYPDTEKYDKAVLSLRDDLMKLM